MTPQNKLQFKSTSERRGEQLSPVWQTGTHCPILLIIGTEYVSNQGKQWKRNSEQSLSTPDEIQKALQVLYVALTHNK